MDKHDRLFKAFVTVHHFTTGNYIIATSKHAKTNELLDWLYYRVGWGVNEY